MYVCYSKPCLSILLKHFWQPLVILGVFLQVWHTRFGSFSIFLFCRSSQAQVQWMCGFSTESFVGLSTDVQLDLKPLASSLFTWSGSVLVLPNFYHFHMIETTGLFGMFYTAKHFGTLSQVCALTQSSLKHL
ncbi:hypothetical protein XENOCAPTIV_019802 [Xenoophorus captivus]|uniref:Uncharacterized protein n=1 Tax=Xenoophorus captivus TaxID=1517983 RepID=A0ABV0QAV6_9TELE